MPHKRRFVVDASASEDDASEDGHEVNKPIIKRQLRPRPEDSLTDPDVSTKEQERVTQAKKQAMENLFITLTCPITLALMVKPLIMGDGISYEEEAVREYIRGNTPLDGRILSPTTRQWVADIAVPNVTLRNTIVDSIEAGIIEGPLVEDWRKRREKNKMDGMYIADLKKRIDDGEACKKLGIAYMQGFYGVEMDSLRARDHFKMASDLNNVTGTALYGFMVLTHESNDDHRDDSLGMANVMAAAVQGSEFACSLMADAFAMGDHGIYQSRKEATRWYNKMASCQFRDADTMARTECEKYLALPHGHAYDNEGIMLDARKLVYRPEEENVHG